MKKLIDNQGSLRYGLYDEPIDCVNHEDYILKTPMGLILPDGVKKFRAKQFIFLGIMGPEVMLGMGVVDLNYLANAFLYVYDRKTGDLTETKRMMRPANVRIAPYPDQLISRAKSEDFHIEMAAGRISAKSGDISVDAELEPITTSPLRLASRVGYRGWTYTQKTTPIRLSGEIVCKSRAIRISSPDYMALTDWTAGYMRWETFWNWAATAQMLPDGRPFGLNLSWGINETGFTENAFWLNGRMTKVDTVNFLFNRHDLSDKWHITSHDGKVDLAFSPQARREEKLNLLILASNFVQLMGEFEGQLISDEGESLDIRGCPGWVEDHYSRW